MSTYTLILTASPNGTYLTGLAPNGATYYPDGTYQIASGGRAYFGVVPNAGYAFQKWVLDRYRVSNGDYYSSTDPYSTSPTASFSTSTLTYYYVLTPFFTPLTPVPTHTLTVIQPAEGTISPSTGTYDEGTVVTITALANTGYAFTNWLLDGLNAGSLNPATITMDADHTLTAVFSPFVATYTLSILEPDIAGSCTMAEGQVPYQTYYYIGFGANVIPVGTRVGFRVIPATGYVFSHWRYWDWQGILSDPSAYDNPDSFSSSTANLTFTLQPVLVPETVKRTITFNSRPVAVTATINGVPVQSGESIQVDDGATVIVVVPADVTPQY